MATTEDVALFKSLISSIKRTFNELDEVSSNINSIQDVPTVLSQFREDYTKLARLTYNGELSPAFRRKLSKVDGWLNNLEKTLDKENKFKVNKNNVLNMEEVEKYISYCNKIKNYFESSFPKIWEELDVKNSEIEDKFKDFKRNLKNFEVVEDVDVDKLKADDEINVDIAEPKAVSQIKSTVKDFADLIKKISSLKNNLNESFNELIQVDISNIFQSRKDHSGLITSLIKNFTNLNKLIYKAKFNNNLAIRNKYNELINEAIRKYDMPKDFLMLEVKNVSTEQDQVDRSLPSLKKQIEMDKKNPIDTFVSPWNKSKKQESEIPVEEKDPVVLVSLPKMPQLSKEEKEKYEQLWKNDPKLSPLERSKYEALWAFIKATNLIKNASK